MRALTPSETKDWCLRQGVPLGKDGRPVFSSSVENVCRFNIVKDVTRLYWFANFVERTLRPRQECLLWVTQAGVWPTAENWHLYYRLRQTYGEYRLMEEAPGHLFLEYEGADLASFIEIGVIAGWDMHILTGTQGYGRAFVSHDEWIEFAMDDPSEVEAITKAMT